MRIRWQDWINVGVGFWLCISPWQLEHTLDKAATGNACALGAAVIAFNLISVCRLVEQGQEIVNLLFAVWLLLSPYALSFANDSRAMANAMASGVVICVMGLWQMWDASRTSAGSDMRAK